MEHLLIASAVSLVAGLIVGYKYAKSKFATGLSTVVSDIKKL